MRVRDPMVHLTEVKKQSYMGLRQLSQTASDSSIREEPQASQGMNDH